MANTGTPSPSLEKDRHGTESDTHSRSKIPDWVGKLILTAISTAVLIAVEEGVRRYCCRTSTQEEDHPAPPSAPVNYYYYEHTQNIEIQLSVNRPNTTTADESDDQRLIVGP